MSVNLSKGQKVNLSKQRYGLSKVMVGLGWDEVQQRRGLFAPKPQDIDCDAFAILLGYDGHLINHATKLTEVVLNKTRPNTHTAALRYQQCQNQLQQVQAAKAQALRYLQATRSELTNVIKSIEEKLPKFDQSISTFEQMASNPFGASASAQLPQLRARRAEYQQNLNDAYTLVDRIDSALNGGGNSPQKVLRRR